MEYPEREDGPPPTFGLVAEGPSRRCPMLALLARVPLSALRRAFAVALLAGLTLMPSANADTAIEKVRGFFCNAKADQLAFLTLQAKGENEEIAANTVNKSIAKFSCAYYIPATAVHTGDHTVIDGGLVFKLQSFMFLPEKVERWSGSVLGAMPQQDATAHDI